MSPLKNSFGIATHHCFIFFILSKIKKGTISSSHGAWECQQRHASSAEKEFTWLVESSDASTSLLYKECGGFA